MLVSARRLLQHRELIRTLVAREVKARYRGTILGFFWSFANPLLLLLVYTFVFSVILPGFRGGDLEPYALFLFCGLLPWTWFASSLLESSNVLIANGNLLKKVMFPAEILPIVTVLANMVHFLFGLPVLGAFLVYYALDGRLPGPLQAVELLWLPAVILVQLLLTLGLALILSALTVHFRDIRDLLGNLLTLWFFATPIIYPMSLVPAAGKPLMDLNPVAHLAISYQEILFYNGPFGHWKWLLALGVASLALAVVGYGVFDRLRDTFAEEV